MIRPPFLDLSLLQRGERFQRLLPAREGLHTSSANRARAVGSLGRHAPSPYATILTFEVQHSDSHQCDRPARRTRGAFYQQRQHDVTEAPHAVRCKCGGVQILVDVDAVLGDKLLMNGER
jgi:hypothetical protein